MQLADARAFVDAVKNGNFDDPRIVGLAGTSDILENIGVGIELLAEPNEYGIVLLLEAQDGATLDLANVMAENVPGEVKIRYSGRIQLESAVSDSPPTLSPGLSIGPLDRNIAGTLGCFVRLQNGDIAILSNAHVLAPSMLEKSGGGICHPGLADGGGVEVARVSVVAPVRRDVVEPIDVAAATVLRGCPISTNIKGLSLGFSGVGSGPPPEALVSKSGRTTGLTNGRIQFFDFVTRIDYPGGPVRLTGLTGVFGLDGRFTAPGDSGSIVYGTLDSKAYGLHVAGSSDDLGRNAVSLFHPFDRALARIGASLYMG